jgi:hypothetical protein
MNDHDTYQWYEYLETPIEPYMLPEPVEPMELSRWHRMWAAVREALARLWYFLSRPGAL